MPPTPARRHAPRSARPSFHAGKRVSANSADLVPILLKIKGPDPWVVEGQRTLVGWDYSSTKDSAAAAYFNVVCHNIFKLTFRDELP